MTFRDPRVPRQLNNGSATSDEDCTFRCCQGALAWEGVAVPTVAEMRAFLGVPHGGIDMLGAQQIVRHYSSAAAQFVRDSDIVWAALDSGSFVVAAVDYGWVNDNAPHLSGQNDFRGNHAVGLFGVEPVLRRRYTEWHDPLMDNRRRSIPKSNGMARRRHVDGAMAAMSKGVQALIVTRSAA